MVGFKAGSGLEEPEVTSLVKSTMEVSAHEEEGFLDLGSKENTKPKAKRNLKKLAREKGPGEVSMMDQEKLAGIKRARELEKLEAEENRKSKKKYEQISKGTGMSAKQHCREP